MLYQWVTWEALSWFTQFLWWKLLQQLLKKGAWKENLFEILYVWIIFQFSLPLYLIVCIGIEFQGFPGSSTGKESSWNAGDPGLIPGSGRSPGKRIEYLLQYSWASLVAQTGKNLPAMWETWVQSLGWKIPWRRRAWQPTLVFLLRDSSGTEEPGGL